MDDILSALDEVTEKTSKKSAPKVEVGLSRVDYDNLKKVAKTTQLYAVKNVGNKDLSCDWDINLMPEDLKKDFDKYLSDRYNVYQIKESNLDFRIVVLYRDGRSINFLHQFMTERRIPNLESVQEGPEVVIKSQFVLPKGQTAIITQVQYDSLKKYEKKRVKTKEGDSDWFGSLVFKPITERDFSKINHSFVSSTDVKNNEFVIEPEPLSLPKSSATMEYSDELDNL